MIKKNSTRPICRSKTTFLASLRVLLFRELIHSPIFAFCYQDDARNITKASKEQHIARNGKLQYFFQKQFQSFRNEHDVKQIFFTDKMCIYDV